MEKKMPAAAKTKKKKEDEEIQDEFTLQPDEYTRETLATKLGWTSPRNVDNIVNAGKIGYLDDVTRRIKGKLKTGRIFTQQHVDDYLKKGKEVKGAVVVKEESENLTTISNQVIIESLGRLTETMKDFSNQVIQQNQNLLPPPPEKPFLSVKEAAELTELSESCIRKLVLDGDLKKFTGKHGETIISRKQLFEL